MTMVDYIQATGEMIQAKTTAAEYWKLINAEMNSLYLLAFLLTADKEEAEKCFGEALDGFVDGHSNFIEWARTAGRRAIFRHAVAAIKPQPEDAQDWRAFGFDTKQTASDAQPFGAIIGLHAFERFVFVMTRIDGQSNAACAKLLASTEVDVAVARDLAERTLAVTDSESDQYPCPVGRCA